MTLQSVLIFCGLTLALSVAAHWVVRRYWWAVLVSVTAASITNLIHEAFRHDFQVRPADIAFWIPMEFVYCMLFASPVAVVVGIPFYVIRRRKHSNAAS
jgi:hypothetical protein